MERGMRVFFIQKEYSYKVIFLLFVIMNSLVFITGIAFAAIRKADFYLKQNIILATRVPLLIPLAFLGSLGIFNSVGLAFLFSALFSLIYLNKYIKLNFKIDRQFMKKSFKFSFGNYVSGIFTSIPALILPIMVLSLSGEAAAAKYYIAFAVGSLVMIVPDALCTSLFIEGSHGENLRKNVFRVGLIIYSFLIPAIIFIYLFGDHILGLFGKNYVDALDLLKLFAFSTFFSSDFQTCAEYFSISFFIAALPSLKNPAIFLVVIVSRPGSSSITRFWANSSSILMVSERVFLNESNS